MINLENSPLTKDNDSRPSFAEDINEKSELFVYPDTSRDEPQSNPCEAMCGNTQSMSISSQLNPDIFDAEYDSDGDGTDLLPLPGSHFDQTLDVYEEKSHFLGFQFEKKLLKDTDKKESKLSRSRSEVKNRKDELMEIHSETQRIIRESRVQIPYHNPEKQGLSSVLDRIKQKRELFGLSSLRKPSGYSSSKTGCMLSKVSQTHTVRNLTPSPTCLIKNKYPVSSDLNVKGCDEHIGMTDILKNITSADEDDVEADESLMTRLKKRQKKISVDEEAFSSKTNDKMVMQDGEEIMSSIHCGKDVSSVDREGSNKSLYISENTILNPGVSENESNIVSKGNDALSLTPELDAFKRTKEIKTQTLKSKVQELHNLSINPTIVPKLGCSQTEVDDLIFVTESTGVDKLFRRLEKELVNFPKKQQAVELCTASKQSIKGIDSFQMKSVVYEMDKKMEVKKSSRDQLKQTLQVQMMESRQERLQERYEAYKKLGRDKGLVRLEEDELPNDDDDDDGSCTSESSESQGDEESEPEEVIDEEEEAAERQRQENPFIDDEADEDEDDECAVEIDDNDNVNDDDDDNDDDEDVGPIKKRALKIIEEEEDDDKNPKQQLDKEHVNPFEENAMSCQKIDGNYEEEKGSISCRPFKEIGSDGGQHLASCDSFNISHNSQETKAKLSDAVENFLSSSSNSQLWSQNHGKFSGTSASREMSQNEDWVLLKNPNDGKSLSQAVKELCSTQASQGDLSLLCSGSFTTQKEDTAGVQRYLPVKTSKKRKHDSSDDECRFSCDNEDENDSNQFHNEETSDHEEATEGKYLPMRSNGRINEEFVEKEAELSGSEIEDEDEEGIDDEMEVEEGDFDDVGTEEELRNQVNRVHMKSMIDQDKREIRLLQEHLLEDGDLHDDGMGRMRRFRWKNLDDENDQEGRNNSDDEETKDEDVTWRMMRLEREKFLQKQQEEDEEEQHNSQIPHDGQKKLKLVSSFQQESPLQNDNHPSRVKPLTPQAKVQGFTPKSVGPKPVGSFLNRGREALAKFSDSMKTGTSTFSNNTSTMVSRNNRNFVFAHLSPSKNAVLNEQKKENKTSQSGMPPKKKQHVDNEPPQPQSRILKYLNDY